MQNQFVTPETRSAPDSDANAVRIVKTLSGETQFQQQIAADRPRARLAAMQITDGPQGMQTAYNAVERVPSVAPRAPRLPRCVVVLERTAMRADTR